jgi:hypothetical protein
VQPTVALSTAESDFLAASDTGRLGLFIRSVLTELLQPQHAATTVYEDNNACRMVTDKTAPTRQMRHIAIRDFALQDWTERNLISITACASNTNASDMFTKQVRNILFARHHDHISGRTTFFRINPDLLHVPRSSSGARGGVVVYRPVVPGLPQPRFIIIALNNFPRFIVSLSSYIDCL